MDEVVTLEELEDALGARARENPLVRDPKRELLQLVREARADQLAFESVRNVVDEWDREFERVHLEHVQQNAAPTRLPVGQARARRRAEAKASSR